MSRPSSYSGEKHFNFRIPDQNNPNTINNDGGLSVSKAKKHPTIIPITNPSFLTNIKGPIVIQEEPFMKVYELYDQLSGLIDSLDYKIDDILSKHENEFVSSYRSHMYKIQQELKELKRKTDETEVKMRENDQIQNLEKSINFFREESLKLTDTLNKKNKEIQSLKNRVKFLEEEKQFLASYLKTVASKAREQRLNQSQESEDIIMNLSNNPTYRSTYNQKTPISSMPDITPSSFKNRSISLLKKNTMPTKDKDKDKDQAIFHLSKIQHDDMLSMPEYNTGFDKLDDFLNELKYKNFDDKYVIINDVQMFIKSLVDNYELKLKILKKDLDHEFKEKMRILSQRTDEFSNKSELENLFIDCIEQVKRDIIKRKSLQKPYYDKLPPRQDYTNEPIQNEFIQPKIDYKQFLNIDKHRIIELFLTQEQVLLILYDLLFPRSGNANLSSTNNNTVDLDTTRPQNDILDDLSKENLISNPNLDNFNVSDRMTKQKKKTSDSLAYRNRITELNNIPSSETKKKIYDLLSDSALYNEIKLNTTGVTPHSNITPSRRRAEWKPNTEGKRFKI